MIRRRRQTEVWQTLGRHDGDWAVLTDPLRRSGGWSGELEAFYASGKAEVEACLALAETGGRAKALDYGCGTGRLSFALADRFDAVTSLDIADGMLETLRQRAAARGISNITPVPVGSFQPAGDHDFALSLLVLQHLPDHDAVRQAVSLISHALRPDGMAVLEIPAAALTVRARLQPRLHVYALLRSLGVPAARLHRLGFSGISMLVVDRPSAQGMFEACGLRVIGSSSSRDGGHEYVRWALRRSSPESAL